MGRATFGSGSGGYSGGRSLKKPLIWSFTVCSLMVSMVTVSEKFTSGGGGLAGMLLPDSAEGGSQITEMLGGLTGAGGAPSGSAPSVLLTPSGELSAEETAELLDQARHGAPMPIDAQTGQPMSAEELRKQRLQLIGKALAENGG